MTILLIEQNAKQALQISDYGLVLEQGQTRIEARAAEILGDPRIAQLFSRRRSRAIGAGGMTARRMLIGLIGANIQGSMSPALFADAFAAAGIDGYYHLIDADRLPGRRVPELLQAMKTLGFAGANVTYPFKQEIIPLLDAVDPEAAQVGAVNTIAIAPDGRVTGYNFDRRGWRKSFEATFGGEGAADKTVVQIGAGGAGRAVAFALMDLGVATLVLHDLDTAQGRRAARRDCGPLRRRALPPRGRSRARHWRGPTASSTRRRSA